MTAVLEGIAAPTDLIIPCGPEPELVLRKNLGQVEPLSPEELHLEIGAAATVFLIEARDIVADGKLLVDVLLDHGITDIEAFANAGYEKGLSTEQILEEAVGEVKPYTDERPRLVAEPGETMFDFAHTRLRPHQETVIKVGENEYNVRLTCDGRYDPELYLLDMGSVVAGLDETRDVRKIQDLVDLVTEHTLMNGIPFNGMRIKSRFADNPFDEPNYYAHRSQTPTFFDMVRRLGKYGGEAVYTHGPYVQAMEKIWQHFNPEQNLLAAQPDGQFHAFRRGGISPEGLPFSVYGDDRNNGLSLEDYVGREESLAEDELTAVMAAMSVPPEERAQKYADTKVHLRAAGECGWDMSLSRYASGENLSTINTTNIIALDLQLMLIDAGRMLAHSYELLANQAEAAGDEDMAMQYLLQQESILDHVERRTEFVETYLYDEATGTYHDGVLEEPSGTYDSMRTYTGFHRSETVSAATGHVLRTLAHNGHVDRLMSTARVAQAELFGPGGVAATNVTTNQQWDGPQGWAYSNLGWIEYTVEAAAAIYAEHPEEAEELLQMAEDRIRATIYGSQRSFEETGMIVETNNTLAPGEKPVEGEYPKDPKKKDSPQNFAMQAELVIFATLHDPRARFWRLVAAGGRETMILAA